MKYIKITELKKEAKKLRKCDLKIKNQAESLNLIAKKYNKKTWTNLLDDAVLPLETEIKDFEFSNKITTRLLKLFGNQMVRLRSITSMRNQGESERLRSIYHLSDLFHNVSRLACDGDRLNTIRELESHISFFTRHLETPEYFNETVVEGVGQIIYFKHWIDLFEDMLLEIK